MYIKSISLKLKAHELEQMQYISYTSVLSTILFPISEKYKKILSFHWQST